MRSSRFILLTVLTALLGAGVSCGVGAPASRAIDDSGGNGTGATSGSASGGTTGSGATGSGGTIINPLAGSGGKMDTSMCAPPDGPYCGNNVVDAGEACDDGNQLPGDGCTGICVV